MRTRVETLLGTNCRAMWISTFHALCARLLRREAPHIGLSRDFVIYDSADQQSVVKQLLKEYGFDDIVVSAAGGPEPDQPRQEPHGRPGDLREELESEGPRDCAALRRLPARAQGGERARFRRSAAEDGRAVRSGAGGPRALRAQVSVRDGRRVSGHEPAAVPADQAARQPAPEPGRGRRSRSVDLQVARRRPAQHPRFRDRLSRVGRRPARAQLPLDAGHSRCRVRGHRATTATARRRRSGPTGRAAPRSSTSAAPTSSKRPTTSRASRAQALAENVEHTMAVLYRTNAQSRSVEDGLRQANIAYVVLGGVGFYERKEIKDALSYLKLILNPHDDVALRRVINVPARGIGKGVMDALEQVDVGAVAERSAAAASPGLAAGRRRRTRSGPSWSPPPSSGCSTPRQVASLTAFRDLDRVAVGDGAAGIGVDRAWQGARSIRVSARPARGSQRGGRGTHREPDGAGLGRARVRDARAGAVARRLRRSTVAAVRRRQGARQSRARVSC